MEALFDITVFTPTYNRAYVLPCLYSSLLKQSKEFSFEWLIIDDGSVDDTENIVQTWCDEGLIPIQYHKVKNGGKPRAINKAVEWARSELLFIVDSDDYLSDTAIGDIMTAYASVRKDNSIAGVGGLRGNEDLIPIKSPQFMNHVDATNLDRCLWGLDVDCSEAYKIEVLKKYPFEVWDGELFIPEAVVLNEMALDGYKIRWIDKVIVVSEYLPDGMTKGAWRLMKKNPMGYAMFYNHKLKYLQRGRERLYAVAQMIAFVFLAGNINYLLRSHAKMLTVFCLPLGFLLSLRRKLQYKKYCTDD